MDRKRWSPAHDHSGHGQSEREQPFAERDRTFEACLGGLPPRSEVVVMDVSVVCV